LKGDDDVIEGSKTHQIRPSMVGGGKGSEGGWMRSGLEGFCNGIVDQECTIEVRDLNQRHDFFLEPYQFHGAPVFSHLSLRNQERAQAAAVTKFDIGEIKNQVRRFAVTQDEKLALEFWRNGGVKFPLFQPEHRCTAVLLDFKLHNHPQLEHFQTPDKIPIGNRETIDRFRVDLKIVKFIRVVLEETHPQGGV